MKNYLKLVSIILILFSVMSCGMLTDISPDPNSSNNNTTNSSSNTGKAVFWTASPTLGGAYIDVYVQGVFLGKITKYSVNGTGPSCDATPDGYPLYKAAPGTYTFRAVGEDGTQWPDQPFVITKNGCLQIQF